VQRSRTTCQERIGTPVLSINVPEGLRMRTKEGLPNEELSKSCSCFAISSGYDWEFVISQFQTGLTHGEYKSNLIEGRHCLALASTSRISLSESYQREDWRILTLTDVVEDALFNILHFGFYGGDILLYQGPEFGRSTWLVKLPATNCVSASLACKGSFELAVRRLRLPYT
jgi:hypothetical protein